ncbi:MAG: nodulation protein NfeD, partial [Spirochaetia bacterium]
MGRELLFGLWMLIVTLAPAPAQGGSPAGDASGASGPDAYVVPIHGVIDRPLAVYIMRSVERARADGVSFVIFDIDTFGGRVDSALEITTRIGSLTDIE